MSEELMDLARRISTSAGATDRKGYLILAPGEKQFDATGYVVISRSLLWRLQMAIGLDPSREHVRRRSEVLDFPSGIPEADEQAPPDGWVLERAPFPDEYIEDYDENLQ